MTTVVCPAAHVSSFRVRERHAFRSSRKAAQNELSSLRKQHGFSSSRGGGVLYEGDVREDAID